ncbi:MAG: hypothetical protein HKN00_10190 [Flavobacteriaceae bacterium]|nr:hypothetical protein [Bacteroidia bacterium]NNF75545.1 hypothetical protein [Flavobacteriaceae bacterium]NNK73467.1 hypothetical protein [Flavobacteriaceae bacterium]
MATVIPAKHLAPYNALAGTISKGQTADLVLLEKNPFEDMTTLKNPELVIKDGIVLNKSMLNEKLNQLDKLLNN